MPNPFSVRISTLYVGQGQANVIEVYRSIDDSDFYLPPCPDILTPSAPTTSKAYLAYLGVVDFGSAKNVHVKYYDFIDPVTPPTTYNAISASFFLGKLAKQRALSYEAKTGNKYMGYFDNLLISHLDSDHYNLLDDLTDYTYVHCPAGWKKELAVGHLSISGSHSRRDTRYKRYTKPEMEYIQMKKKLKEFYYNILNTNWITDPYKRASIDPYGAGTGYDFKFDLGGGMELRGNVLVAQSQLDLTMSVPNNVFINTGSSVMVVSIVDGTGKPIFSSLFPGDATIHTFIKFNDALPDFQFKDETKYSAIPHHGGYHDVSDDWDTAHTIQGYALSAFIAKYRPHCAMASAKACNHGHPDARTMQKYFNGLSDKKTIPALDESGNPADVEHECSTNNELVANIRRTAVRVGTYGPYYRTAVKHPLYTTYIVPFTEKANPFIPMSKDVEYYGHNANLHLTYNKDKTSPLYLQYVLDEADE